MATFIWLTFYYVQKYKIKESLKSYFFALGFHISALVFLPVIFFAKKITGKKTQIIIILTAYIVGVKAALAFNLLNNYVAPSIPILNYYLNDFYRGEEAFYQLGMGFFLYISIFVIARVTHNLFRNKEDVLFFVQILFFGICVILFFYSVAIFVERIANILLISVVFIFASIDKLRVSKSIRVILVCVIGLINFLFLWKILQIPGVDQSFQFLPYKITIPI